MDGYPPEHWLTMLRDGSESQKLEARWRLSLIFEQDGRLEEASELLEGNVSAGARDAMLYRHLASLYRRLGRQDLADGAIAEAYRNSPATADREHQVSHASPTDPAHADHAAAPRE